MQQREHRPDYHTVDDPSVASALDTASSPPFWPVLCRAIRITPTPTLCGANSGGTATCGSPSARPWCRGQ